MNVALLESERIGCESRAALTYLDSSLKRAQGGLSLTPQIIAFARPSFFNIIWSYIKCSFKSCLPTSLTFLILSYTEFWRLHCHCVFLSTVIVFKPPSPHLYTENAITYSAGLLYSLNKINVMHLPHAEHLINVNSCYYVWSVYSFNALFLPHLCGLLFSTVSCHCIPGVAMILPFENSACIIFKYLMYVSLLCAESTLFSDKMVSLVLGDLSP